VIERLQLACPEFQASSILARTGKCLLIRGTLAGIAAVAKCLVEPDAYWSTHFAKEIRWYRLFTQHTPPVAIPRLLFADEALGLSVLEFLEGQPLCRTRYATQPLPPRQIDTLVTELSRLHSWRVPQLPSSSELVADYREKFRSYADRGFLSAADCSDLMQLLGRDQSDPEFNHGDLLLSNCLALGAGLALIDWEFAGYYLPGYDLALLWTLLQADSAARRCIIETVRRRGAAAERAFFINQMRVIVREIRIHQKEAGVAIHDDRVRRLLADCDAVRASIRTHLVDYRGTSSTYEGTPIS
jgi:aminoglycoside phosphotransferase (APT) family kinase protein